MPVNNLTPTIIADKNGKITTVHRKDMGAGKSSIPRLPAPMVAMQSAPAAPDPEYAARRESIATMNQRCRTEGVSDDERMKLADLSMPVLSSFLNVVSEVTDKDVSQEFVMKVRPYIRNNDFAPLVVADRFAGSANHFLDEMMEGEYELDDYEDEKVGFGGQYAVISVFETLRDLDLMGYTEVPDASDKRFMAHLKLSCHEEVTYNNYSGVEVQHALIRLVDEFPDRSKFITEYSRGGLSENAIRAVLSGEMDKNAMINGVL